MTTIIAVAKQKKKTQKVHKMNLLNQVIAQMHKVFTEEKIGTRFNEKGELVCYYCGEPLPGYYERDHFIPRDKGGVDDEWNIVRACQSCNASKQARFPTTLLANGWFAEREMPDDIAIDFFARILLAAHLSRGYISGDEVFMKVRSMEENADSDLPFGIEGNTGAYRPLPFMIRVGTEVKTRKPCPQCDNGKIRAQCSTGYFVVTLVCTNCDWSCRLESFEDDEIHTYQDYLASHRK